MRNDLENLLLSDRRDFAGVPYIDQYVGAWAIRDENARMLLGQAENINLQLHLEQHGSEVQPKASGGMLGSAASELAITKDGIAVIELRGTLMKQASSYSGGTSTVRARRQLRLAANNEDVTGVFLIVDSPGGTVAGMSDLAEDIRAAAAKKPCFTYVEDLCASAAYWAASQTHRISAGSGALTGSIGVFSVVYDMSRKAEADGITVHVVRFGEFKWAGTPGTKITEEQLARWQKITDAHGEDFVNAVATGRKLSVETVRSLADGDIHKGDAARKKQLVDAIESKDEAYAALVAETKKPSSKKRGSRMSESTTEGNATEQKPSQPAAATLAELRDACPGASSDFLLAQLDKKATAAEAMKANIKSLADANAAQAKELAELKAKSEAANATPPKGKRGVAPITAGDGEDEANDEAWSELGANEFARVEIAKRVALGQTRDRATKAVFNANEGLRDAMCAEAEALKPKRK